MSTAEFHLNDIVVEGLVLRQSARVDGSIPFYVEDLRIKK